MYKPEEAKVVTPAAPTETLISPTDVSTAKPSETQVQ